MAVANALGGEKVKIYISDGVTSGDGKFKFMCEAEENSFNRELEVAEKMQRDCTSEDAVAVRTTKVTGKRWNIGPIRATVDPARIPFTVCNAAVASGDSVEVKVVVGSAGAGFSYTGFVKVVRFNITGGVAPFAQMDIELQGTGDYTQAALA